jgi:hypothetical protein
MNKEKQRYLCFSIVCLLASSYLFESAGRFVMSNNTLYNVVWVILFLASAFLGYKAIARKL